jgi:hypothetical protein
VTGPLDVALPVGETDGAAHVPVGAATYSMELKAGPHANGAEVPEQSDVV